MAEKKYQVFISSTYSDLVDERRRILDILLMAAIWFRKPSDRIELYRNGV